MFVLYLFALLLIECYNHKLFLKNIVILTIINKDHNFMSKIPNADSYDETPYHSYPYSQSSPEKLATMGKLFGMTPPDIETARVLELGCAEGGNIIPHAVHYPKGNYVGVDLSKVQIEAGQKNIKELGLKNIELKHCSITDIDESFGKFDYIICHGVISWVPDFVREKIFEVASKNLTENGVAYISYNTLPGWNMIRTIRDMMIYHSKGFSDPKEKVDQSRALLSFVKDSVKDSETPHSKMLATEAELLSKQGDHYLRHEHLEDENFQYYFSDFMERAEKNNMQYLSDVSLASMYLGNMKNSVVEKLKELNNIVRTEQYMDFITNRRFRSTLLCHKSVKLNRSLNLNDAARFALSFNVIPEKQLNQVNLEDNSELKFFYEGNKDNAVSTSAPGLKAIFYVLSENRGYPLYFQTIIEKAKEKLKNTSKDQIENDLLSNAMNLIMKGYIQISIKEQKKEDLDLSHPKVSSIVSLQVKNSSAKWVTNLAHQPVHFDSVDRIAIGYLNGKNDKQQILDALFNEVKDSKITLNKDDKQVTEEEDIKKELNNYIDAAIERFVLNKIIL